MAKWGKQPRPRATHRGMLRVGGDIEIPCYVLENGTRVISGRGITTAIGMKGRGQGMQRIGQLRIINPYMSDELRLAIENPITIDDGGAANMPSPQCYEAILAPSVLICAFNSLERKKPKPLQ